MPWIWLPEVFPPNQPQTAVQRSLGQYGDQLEVVGKVQEIDVVRSVETYTDGVVAKFGPTTVFADRLEIHYADQDRYGVAKGNVRLEDPEGKLKANYVIFWYGPNKGPDGQIAVADRVEVELGHVLARAESAVIKKDRWEFLNVEGTNCFLPTPVYLLKSKKIIVEPGKEGVAYSPKLHIFGRDFGPFPTRRFSLDRRNPGIQIPSVSFKKGSGLGVSWSSGILLDDRSLITGDFSSYPRQYPSYGLAYARSFVGADASSAKIFAKSELSERFANSYFDDVRVANIQSSERANRQIRNSITLQSIWNTGSSARIEGERFNKAFEAVYDRSGPIAGFGFGYQLRAQSIESENTDLRERGLGIATLHFPQVQIAKGLVTDVRLDGLGKVGGNGPFGWLRGQAGLVFQPIPQLAFGAAYVSAGETGTPDFLADRLVSKRATHFRADLNLGPTKISYLAKFDFDRNTWYDQEYSVSQVIGCLEPYLVKRQFPNDYVLGVRLRLGDFLGILQRRKQVRTKPIDAKSGERTVISELK